MNVMRKYQRNLDALDADEVHILTLKGAFDLPHQRVQDDLLNAFFTWIAPLLPVIDQKAFWVQYNDTSRPPSLLLLQSMFLAGSRVEPGRWTDSKQGEMPHRATASNLFFKRAKALYDAGFEKDKITIVQSLVLMSWYWDGIEDLTENGLFYWTRLAIAVAQSFKMDISDGLPLSQRERRLWRRIWWTLFTRDRAMASAYGRPVSIQVEFTNVQAPTVDDFVESEDSNTNSSAALFFIQYVRLCEMMDVLIRRRTDARWLSPSELAQWENDLCHWSLSCPAEMQWYASSHQFWPGILQSVYYTMVCQLHALVPVKVRPPESASLALDAASTIISIFETLTAHGQINYVPPSAICSLLTVLAAAKNQRNPASPIFVLQWKKNVQRCLHMLEQISYTWPIARPIKEGAEIIYLSTKWFDSSLEKALKWCKNRAENTVASACPRWERPFPKRKRLNPDLLLPQSRLIVRPTTGSAQARVRPESQASATFVTAISEQASRERTSQRRLHSDVSQSPCAIEDFISYLDPVDVLESLRSMTQLECELASSPAAEDNEVPENIT